MELSNLELSNSSCVAVLGGCYLQDIAALIGVAYPSLQYLVAVHNASLSSNALGFRISKMCWSSNVRITFLPVVIYDNVWRNAEVGIADYDASWLRLLSIGILH